MELLEAINRLGTTVVVVTHEVGLAREFGKRVVELKDGRIVSDTGRDAQ